MTYFNNGNSRYRKSLWYAMNDSDTIKMVELEIK